MRRVAHALSAKAQRQPDVPPRGAGPFRLHLARSHGMDRVETGAATDQYLRVGHILPDVPAGAAGEKSNQDLPDLELRAWRFLQAARVLLQKAWFRPSRA